MEHEAGPVFYLDLGSPECLLSAERILGVMPVATEWVPVHLATAADAERFAQLAQTAAERSLQPMRMPAEYPFDAELANLTATYAKQIGRSVAFAQAALRQAYAGGRDLSDTDNVVIAASACEMHPTAVVKTVHTRPVTKALAAATELALARGVTTTPSFWLPDGRVFAGDDKLEEAAAAAEALAA